MACEKSIKTRKDISEKRLQHPFFPFSHLSKDCLKPQFFRHQLQLLEGPLALRSESFVPSCDPEGNRDSMRVGSLALFWMGGTELHGGWFSMMYIHMILMCTKTWCKFCIEATKETLCLDTLCKQWCLNWLFIHSIHLMDSLPHLGEHVSKGRSQDFTHLSFFRPAGKKWPSRSSQLQTFTPLKIYDQLLCSLGKREGKWFFFSGGPLRESFGSLGRQAIKMRKWISLAVILW